MDNIYGSSFSVVPASDGTSKVYYPINDVGGVSTTSTDSILVGKTVVLESVVARSVSTGTMTIATSAAIAAVVPSHTEEMQFGDDGILIVNGSTGVTSLKFSVPAASLSSYIVIWRRV